MIAAAAMALSSISVLMNAMRLTRYHTSVGSQEVTVTPIDSSKPSDTKDVTV